MQPATKNKPVHEVRIGMVKAAIWKHEHENGARYTTNFSRFYKDKEGDEWKFTEYFGRDDLLLLAKLADQTHTWICEQTQNQEKPQDREGGGGGRFRGNPR